MSVYEFIQKGGLFLYPIGACFIVAITVFVVKLWSLGRIRVHPPELVRSLMSSLREERYEEAEAACVRSGTPAARIAYEAIKNRTRRREVLREIVTERGSAEVSRLERGTGVLSTVATIAPMLGLLGTVTGMMNVFMKIQEETDPEIGLLAGGIWEALITTGAGLIVAIPTYIFYRWLMTRIDRLADELEETGTDIVNVLDREA